MENHICTTCGTQFRATESEPERCPVCDEERQYIGWGGQEWTTLEDLQKSHRNSIRKKEDGLYAIGTIPEFGIGQRALLLQHPEGNILWDCISLIDEATIDFVKGLGGLSAIAISHPHYYSSMVAWSQAFGNTPIYLHEDDRQWVMRPHGNIHFWKGETLLLNQSMTLIRCGGHFDGGTVLHWPEGAKSHGALLTGDIIQVVQDRRFVSFMYSYPNLIPLPAKKVQRIVDAVEPYAYDRIYGAWWDKNILTGAKKAVHDSARRYIEAIKL